MTHKRTINSRGGFTLVEMLVVVAIMAIMLAMAVPSIPGMLRSNKMASAKNTIKSTLGQAQAYAAATQKYAGVRFQQANNGRQYLVVIEHRGDYEFTAIPNAKPAALPVGIALISGVIDIISNDDLKNDSLRNYDPDDPALCMENLNTFSIIFSPTGQLVVKNVEVVSSGIGRGMIFGTYNSTVLYLPSDGRYRLLSHDQTDSADWCNNENSTAGLYFYEVGAMGEVRAGLRYSEFINRHVGNNSVERIMINIYTGGVIEEE